MEKERKKRTLITGAICIFSLIGLVLFIYAEWKGVKARDVVRILKKVGRALKKHPLIAGACIVGLIAIAVTLYFLYRRRVV